MSDSEVEGEEAFKERLRQRIKEDEALLRRLAENPPPSTGVPQRCPRRGESPNPDAYAQEGGPDFWQERAGYGAHHALQCSYCGAIHPDVFMENVRAGWEVGPTDKSYKAYLRAPDGAKEHKFYYQHLSEDQRREFIALYNDKTMKIGVPGHFYVTPFFANYQEAAE